MKTIKLILLIALIYFPSIINSSNSERFLFVSLSNDKLEYLDYKFEISNNIHWVLEPHIYEEYFGENIVLNIFSNQNSKQTDIVGKITNNGKGVGTYCSLAVEKLSDSDILELKVLSGSLQYVQIIWRNEKGVWFTKYQGNRTRFEASELLKDITPDITHLNFIVNSNHNHFKQGDSPCVIDVFHIYIAGREPRKQQSIATNISTKQATNTNTSTRQTTNTNTSTKQQTSTNNQAQAKQQMVASFNKEAAAKFNELLKKANESFNKPYWEDSQNSRTTQNPTNPKLEALNYLKQAEQLINQQDHLKLRYQMVFDLVNTHSGFAKRVFANVAKVDFINTAGSIVSRYGNTVSSITKGYDGMNAEEVRSQAYTKIAESWRELTKAAMWGGHQYNKAFCDTQTKKYYELALRENRANSDLQKTIEKINAPKKPVPPAVAKFAEIKPEVWNKAQDQMIQLQNEKLQESINKLPKGNYMNICSMSISTGKGTVSLLSAGASDWKVITDKFIDIYPGDKIKTSKDATGVSVTYFSDKSFLAILGGSEVEFYSEYQLYIRRGNVHVRVQKKGREFLIITPTAVCGVRGTEFDMLVNVDKSTETFLYEGVVEIRNSTDIGYLVPGEKMIAKMDEERLEQTKFNTASRKAAVWKDLDSQIQKHEQIIANSSLQKSNPNTSGNYSASSSKNQFSGVSSGSTDNQSNTKSQKENSGSSSNKPKVNSSTNNYTNNKIEICNSPDNNFHEVLINNSFEYGDASLVARCAVNVSQNTPLVVNWYLNDQTQPINVGRYSVVPKASYFDATLISYDAPINPGKYTAEFILNGQITGKSFIQIKSPQRINQADAKKIYANAIQKIDLALQYMNQGDLSGMKQKAISALPELQQALYSDGSLADILAVTQATHALIALEKMDYAVRMSNKQSAKNWLKVYSGYVNQAYSNCKDQQFRVTLQKMKDVIGKLSNEI